MSRTATTGRPDDVPGNDLRAALLEAKRALEASPPGVGEKVALAEACFRLAVMPGGEIEDSIELLRQAVSHDPYHPKLFFHLGRLLHSNGDPQAAVLEYQRALQLAPDSHRTLVHLAVALNDLGREERQQGLRLLEALDKGDGASLNQVVVEVKELVERWLGSAGFAPGKAKEKTPRRAAKAGECRWKGLWKLFLVRELGQPNPVPKKTELYLNRGRERISDWRGEGEYATACILFLLDGRSLCRQVLPRLRDAKTGAGKEGPASRLVQWVCELGGLETAREFVDRASELMQQAEAPPELICCLHYCWYGQAATLDPVSAAALLDRYPAKFRDLPCFRELRIAVLDHHAQLAWKAQRFDRARILWQEILALDPIRAAAAHNLALAAAREKAEDRYPAAWERAAELRYLLAAAAGDVRVNLEDRVSLHRSVSQQAWVRHIPQDGKKANNLSEEKLLACMEDAATFNTWLREWELCYLNSRLRFRSPIHLLGVQLDCSDEDAEAGGRTFVGQFARAFRGRAWAGAGLFQHLTEQLMAEAVERAKNPLLRKRDPFTESEAESAHELENEAIQHGFQLFRVLQLATRSSSGVVKQSGLEAARQLLNMPWRALERVAKRTVQVVEGKDLVDVFASYVASLAQDSTAGPVEARLEALRDCLQGSPQAHDLRLVECRLLLDASRLQDAYESGLAGRKQLRGMSEGEKAKLEKQFVAAVDNAALQKIPSDLRRPGKDRGADFIAAARSALAEFPMAGGLRLLLARVLAQTETPARLAEGSALLQEGFDLFLTAEQVQEARQLLERIGVKSETAEALARIRALLEAAADRTRSAVEAWRADRAIGKMRQALAELQRADEEAAQAEEIAAGAKLPEAAAKAGALRRDFAQLREELSREELRPD